MLSFLKTKITTVMKLSEEENFQYLQIHPKLMYYVGKEKKLIPAGISFKDFMDYSVQEKFPIRNALYENIHLLEAYIKEHTTTLTEDDKAIIRAFKHFKKGTFYVMKLTKKYAHFLGDKYIYGVYALNDPFEMFWAKNNLPVMVQVVLLPFKGKIIYDGVISSYPIHLGRGIRSSIKNSYALAEGKYGIITELPAKVDPSSLENNAEKELLVMMKTKSSRDHNWYDIERLLEKHPELYAVYIKEWGRINSRKKKKELRELGVKKRHFAMYNDTIISSGKTEKELRKEIEGLILEDKKRTGIYYFKL